MLKSNLTPLAMHIRSAVERSGLMTMEKLLLSSDRHFFVVEPTHLTVNWSL